MKILRELDHRNIIHAEEVYLNPNSREVWLLFEYAEHDLFQIIQHHRIYNSNLARNHKPFFIPEQMLKSIIYQIFRGIEYLHSNWILHRDLVLLIFYC